MSTKEEGSQVEWTKVRTPLQYLALTHPKSLIIYGSVITAGSVTNRPYLVVIALVLAGLPQLAMLMLSVVDRKALKALGEDVTQHDVLSNPETHPALADAGPPLLSAEPHPNELGDISSPQAATFADTEPPKAASGSKTLPPAS